MFCPHLSYRQSLRRKFGLGSVRIGASERPVWRHLLRHSDERAASSNECCISEAQKVNDRLVRIVIVKTGRSECPKTTSRLLDLHVSKYQWAKSREGSTGVPFPPGDKVMQIENDYDKDVYNGDIGMIEDVDLDDGEVAVNFDGRTVTFLFGELDTLVPAYAATIHKSQGSEYPAVVIPVMTQHYAMLQRNLIYTGVTRGKKLVVLVGQKKAMAIAVKNVSGRRRWSKLDEWLSDDRTPQLGARATL